MPASAPSRAIFDHFSALGDHREQWRVLHPLREVLLLVLCATLSGMENFVEIRLWGQHRLDFLRRFLPFAHGVPAHDVINALDLDLFKICFITWVEALRDDVSDVIAIDGKTSRRSHARSKGCTPLHMVSAWASRQRLALGQEAVDVKSNEITAMPLLLDRERHKSCERRYYLASIKLHAQSFATAVRAHWGIENRLYWVLDVAFHDDLARLRTGSGPQNMAVVKHIAMNLVRNPKDKHSLKVRRKTRQSRSRLPRNTHHSTEYVNLKRFPCEPIAQRDRPPATGAPCRVSVRDSKAFSIRSAASSC